MLEDEMEINKLEEENRELRNRIKELEEELNYSRCNNNHNHIHNLNETTNKAEDKSLTYEQWLETEEAEQLANAYAEAMNVNTSEESI